MAHLDDFVTIALTQRGDRYVFGAETTFNEPDPVAFDCSELIQWAASRCGISFVDGAQNQRDACKAHGTLIPVAEGRATFGALLFRIDEHPGNDHVAISLGDGHTFEARGKDFGVNIFSTAGRTWTDAGFVPGLERGEPDLTQGDRGADVRWAQRRLQIHGFDPGAADGVFGPHTGAAVCAFQKSRGLTVDGVVGSKTRAKLAQAD